MKFAEEKLVDAWEEAMELLRAHFEEVGWEAGPPLDPDHERYEAINRAGFLRFFTARVEGRLVGYSTFLVSKHLHSRNSTWAIQDVLYVEPEHRGLDARRFIEWADDRLAKAGVEIVLRHSTIRRNYGSVLSRLGYEMLETAWARRVAWEDKSQMSLRRS